VIIWGGSRLRGDSLRSYYVRTSGAYDAKTNTRRRVPPAPIPGGSGYSANWTGSEMILCGDPQGGRRSSGNFGAAYEPATNQWRRIASGPLTGRAGHLVSLIVMPVLAARKRHAARDLDSRPMHADSSQTSRCTYISGVLLLGLVANALFGWWWPIPSPVCASRRSPLRRDTNCGLPRTSALTDATFAARSGLLH
jgi:hypothetical protein